MEVRTKKPWVHQLSKINIHAAMANLRTPSSSDNAAHFIHSLQDWSDTKRII
ncbi:hypothetical protein MTR_1g032390 [Medicago truncatula]|uniref:Uncharacterized protein n=1 Tax=Medicago truncatula TaxID=3880 RepID=G8A040_MEDTR|nr:hypothetical protein MTR_1g032390 [Medicago truncatula]